ncbi:MAG: tripartite tricarboxylate transporter substrate binding protein [Hydrogenophaga sp.]|jgi:tripartite-type tricarboxylate transporter receptor subunit TctC|uniref:Bug family tripartite tricarboxylate transporter substrate binding protein n=1 Tax=Hydrogenophaga sp. TaxID=1904254 RepID=UPI0026399D65|nr:tripartite tricarboxylate transporter substrate binding protein [Hydrogenophaga sp.]MCW5668754.1 tripartite tricarboxylate transporter substrate binding protein [Hydrogenophaga sp.]
MQIQKRRVLSAVALAIATTWACSAAQAAYPEKTISIVVPTSAGGANDAMARTIGQALSLIFKQSVIVDNKAGGNGAIASEFVARAAPDGYTLMLGYIATHAMNPSLQKLRYDPVKDFEPVGMVGYSATLMVANTQVPANSAKELVTFMKANPDKINYASAGNGTAPHFAAEMFKLSTGTAMTHVPYKGSAPAVTDTMAGQTQVMFPSLFTAMPNVKNGKLKALGLAGSKRSPLMPDVPTLKEQGINNVDVSQWYAIFAPAKTPKPVLEQLNKALNQVLADPAVVKRLEEHGAEVDTMGLDEMRSFVAAEQVKWKQVVQAAKLKAD